MAPGTFKKNYESVKQAIVELRKVRSEPLITSHDLKQYLIERTKLSKAVLTHYMPLLEAEGIIRRPKQNIVEILLEVFTDPVKAKEKYGPDFKVLYYDEKAHFGYGVRK